MLSYLSLYHLNFDGLYYHRQKTINVVNVEEMHGIQCTKPFTIGNKVRQSFGMVFYGFVLFCLSITAGVIYSICPAFCPPVDGREYLLFNVKIGAFSVT